MMCGLKKKYFGFQNRRKKMRKFTGSALETISCKKSRRLHKKQLKFESNISTISFERLPIEMTQKVFSYLEIKDLENLARTSRKHSKVVLDFLTSPEFIDVLKRERLTILNLETPLCRLDHLIEYAVALGDLFKAAMVCLTIEEKVALLYYAMHKPEWTVEVNSHLLREEVYLKFYGCFAQRFVNGWSRTKLQQAHHLVESISGIETLISKVFNSNSVDQKCDERSIRDYYQYIYFHYSPNCKHGFLMALILWNYPVEQQAKLLYIIWGIINEGGNIDWEAPLQPLSGYLNSNSSAYVMMDLSNTGKIINTLYVESHFSGQHIMELIRKLISIPEKWNPIQIAQLVLNCGNEVLGLFIREFIVSGQRYELCIFSLQCTFALLVNGYSLDRFVKLFLELYHEEYMGDLRKFIGILPTFAAHLSHMGQVYPMLSPDTDWQRVCTNFSNVLCSHLYSTKKQSMLCICEEQ